MCKGITNKRMRCSAVGKQRGYCARHAKQGELKQKLKTLAEGEVWQYKNERFPNAKPFVSRSLRKILKQIKFDGFNADSVLFDLFAKGRCNVFLIDVRKIKMK